MASPLRYGKSRKENNGPEPINPQQAILAVAPLNSVPYIGPPTPHSYTASSPTKRYTETLEKVATRVGVALTGSAAMGKIGPVIGLMDIGESKDSYFFRVSLPGVARDENGFRCDVEHDGKVVIKGVTTTGEKIVCKNSQIFQMHTQNLCPPGTSLSHSSCQVQSTSNNFLVLLELMGFWKVL